MIGRIVTLLIFTFTAIPVAMAQESLSVAIGVHVFPRQGQDEVQQSKDEAECYSWAADRTGTDPFALTRQANEQYASSEQAMAQAQQAEASTTGRNAATGAVVGGTRTRRAREDATEQVAAQSAQAQAATQEQMEDFRTAFSTCLEAKDYIARF